MISGPLEGKTRTGAGSGVGLLASIDVGPAGDELLTYPHADEQTAQIEIVHKSFFKMDLRQRKECSRGGEGEASAYNQLFSCSGIRMPRLENVKPATPPNMPNASSYVKLSSRRAGNAP